LTLPRISERLRAGEPLADLVEANGLYCNPQHFDGIGELVQLSYHQTRSPRDALLTQQCRGLVLRRSDWAPVCWGMDRFFNHHEIDLADLQPPLQIEEKEDGTYLLLFHNGQSWAAATRHTFCHNDRRYLDLLLSALGHDSLDDFAGATGLRSDVTWCIELCGPQNRIIRPYPVPTAFLLAAYTLDNHTPLPATALDAVPLRRPRRYPPCDTIEEVRTLLAKACGEQRLFEGFVVTDQRGIRIKVKSPLHQRFERYKYQSWAAATPKDLLPYLLDDGGVWLLSAINGLIPDRDRDEYARRIQTYGALIDASIEALEALQAETEGLSRRETAEHLHASSVPMASLLLKRRNQQPLRSLMRANLPQVQRALFPGRAAQSPLTGMLGGHGPDYCPPPAAPSPGMATRPPERTPSGWKAWCACGAPMVLERLKIDRVRYRQCHCDEPFGLHVYRAGSLLWVCGACDATHEAHQQAESWPGEGIPYEKGQPLGIPADHRCKALRLQLHQRLFVFRQARGLSKDAGYRWLADQLGLTREQAHIGLFDAPRCVEVMALIEAES
jgi:hypothetical protein